MRYSEYYIWLSSLVDDGDHSILIRYLYEFPFRWQFTLDGNRAAGGLNLRYKFANDNCVNVQDVGNGPCSILEMLIGLSDRLVEVISTDIFDCFWKLICNLRLEQYTDDSFVAEEVNYILNSWLDRDYDRSGNGSLFPLKEYDGDCRNLDIWGQMNAWVAENYKHTDQWLYE